MEQDIEVGDYVEFVEPNFPRTGSKGTVEGKTRYTAFVCFDDGYVATWPLHYFEKRERPKRPTITMPPPSIPPEGEDS